MKNQYFGDINDYFKYAVLRALSAEGAHSTLVAWMLTPDDGSSDGRKLSYLSQPQQFRSVDSEVFDFLALHRADRSPGVALIQDSGLLSNTHFHAELLRDDLSARSAYFEALYDACSRADIVFFDPDNGYGVGSCPPGARNSSKYVYWAEIAKAFHRGPSVLVYQHFPRSDRRRFLVDLDQQLRDVGASDVALLSTGSVAFTLAMQKHHRGTLWKQIAYLLQRTFGQLRLGYEDLAETPVAVPSPAKSRTARAIDSGEVIRDVSGLTPAEVSRRRVLCPSCQDYVFKEWPFGWDSHSHRCAGLTGSTHEERKHEFKSRWRHLFR